MKWVCRQNDLTRELMNHVRLETLITQRYILFHSNTSSVSVSHCVCERLTELFFYNVGLTFSNFWYLSDCLTPLWRIRLYNYFLSNVFFFSHVRTYQEQPGVYLSELLMISSESRILTLHLASLLVLFEIKRNDYTSMIVEDTII